MASLLYYLLVWSSVIFITTSLQGITWLREPQDVAGVKGQTVRLNCAASSDLSPVGLGWLKDDAPLIQPASQPLGEEQEGSTYVDDQDRSNPELDIGYEDVIPNELDSSLSGSFLRRFVVEEDGRTLVLLNLVKKHEGRYRCLARNTVGAIVSREAMVTVLYPSRHKVELLPEVVYEGDSVRLACSIRDEPPPPDYMWRKDGQPLPKDDRYKIMASGILTIWDTRLEDSGNYSCEIGADDWIHTAEAQLRVLPVSSVRASVPPSLLVRPRNVTYLSEEEAVIDCLASGYPRPQIKWFKEESIMANFGYLFGREGSLRIPNLETLDSGRFTCRAENGQGAVSASAYLTVIDLPKFLDKSDDALRKPTSATLRFWCHFDGHPQPQITWLHDGRSVQLANGATATDEIGMPLGGGGAISGGGGSRFKLQQGGVVLVISQAQPEDSGYYQCVARNAGGEASAVMRAQVKPPQEGAPDPPIDLHVTRVSTSSITLAWTPAPEKDGLGAFAYSIHYFPSSGGAELQKVVVNITVATVEHLASDTVYTFYLLAYNERGSSEQSVRIQSPTLSPGSDGMTVRPVGSVADGSQSRPGGTNNKDRQPSSTLQPPQNVQGSALNATAILVGWDQPPDAWPVSGSSSTGDVDEDEATGATDTQTLSYIVRLRLQDENVQAMLGIEETELTFAVSQTELVLKELRPFSTYRIDVCSKRGDQRSEYSQPPLTIQTPPAAPTEPVGVEATVFSDGTVHVTWKPPFQANGVVTFYHILYTSDPSLPLTRWQRVTQNDVAREGVVNGLSAQQVYYIRVTAETSAGMGPPSLQRTIQTTTSLAGRTTGAFLGTSERDKGIILGVCVGGFCILVCIAIILLRNRCISQGSDRSYRNGLVTKVSRGSGGGPAPGTGSLTAGLTTLPVHQTSLLQHDASYQEMDSFTPMLASVPINHHCDTKGGYDTYPGSYNHAARLHHGVSGNGGLNGIAGSGVGRTRTVSSGYTSDRDFDEAIRPLVGGEGEEARGSARLEDDGGVDSDDHVDRCNLLAGQRGGGAGGPLLGNSAAQSSQCFCCGGAGSHHQCVSAASRCLHHAAHSLHAQKQQQQQTQCCRHSLSCAHQCCHVSLPVCANYTCAHAQASRWAQHGLGTGEGDLPSSPCSLAGSLTGSRDSNKDSGTGTECVASGSRASSSVGGGSTRRATAAGSGEEQGAGSLTTLTLTPHGSGSYCGGSSTESSPQRSGSDGYLPTASSHAGHPVAGNGPVNAVSTQVCVHECACMLARRGAHQLQHQQAQKLTAKNLPLSPSITATTNSLKPSCSILSTQVHHSCGEEARNRIATAVAHTAPQVITANSNNSNNCCVEAASTESGLAQPHTRLHWGLPVASLCSHCTQGSEREHRTVVDTHAQHSAARAGFGQESYALEYATSVC